jgi:iron complex outermembrane receptor protein
MRGKLFCGVGLIALMGSAAVQAQSRPVEQTPATTVQETNSPETSPVVKSSQAAAGTGGNATPAQDVKGLGDIVVTAQRVSENSQKAAVAIGVVGGGDLLKSGTSTVDRLTQLVPALSVQRAGSYNYLFVRGVGNFASASYSDPAIAFNYDGVYVGRPNAAAGVFYDLDRVEVLKGPQGTLYGRNATGGVINVIPTQPKIGSFSGFGSVSYGNYNALNAQAAINAPLGHNAAMRISGNIVSHDGYLRDGGSDEKVQALRVQVKSQLMPNLTARVSFDYAHVGGVGADYSYISGFVYTPTLTTLPLGERFTVVPSGLNLDEGLFSPASQAFRQTVRAGPAGRNFLPLTAFPFQHNNFYGTNAQVDYETGIGTFTFVPAYRKIKLHNLGGAAAGVLNRETDEQTSVELRLAKAHVGILDYNLGLYYFDEAIKDHLTVSRSFLNNEQTYTTGTKSYAGFGRLTAHVTDRLRLVGGLRYTHDKKRFNGISSGLTLICLVRSGCPTTPLFDVRNSINDNPFPIPPFGVKAGPGPVPGTIISRNDTVVDASQKKSKLTYRGAVEFDLAPRSLLYASVETGYRSGGFSLSTGYETYQPEYITAYTLGSKNRFLDNRLQLNLEAFYWKYRDQQQSYVGIDLAGQQGNFTRNVGNATVKGIEVETRFLPTRTTLLSADIQYLKTNYRTFLYQAPAGRSDPPFTTCAVSVAANPTLYDVNCAGKPAYYSPKFTINLAAQQTFEFENHKLVIGADTQYKTKQYVGFEYRPSQLVGAQWRSNANISFARNDERWALSAFVQNIENKRTPTFVTNASIDLAITQAPRTYGVRLSGKF